MRRLVFVPILLLALGLCTSLLVAWAGALLDRSAWPDTLLTGEPVGSRTEMRGWVVEHGRDRTLTWRTFIPLSLWDRPPDRSATVQLPAWSVGHQLEDQPGPFAPARERTRDMAWEASAGWPMRCVRAVRHAGPTQLVLPGEFVRGGVEAEAYAWPLPHEVGRPEAASVVRPWVTHWRRPIVPLRPMPVGLLVNTVVFAAVWFVALSPLLALRPLRRWRRARKNRCAGCGHARDGLPNGAPCPECGRARDERTTTTELLTARAPVLGAALALVLVVTASTALTLHRSMAVDRLPPLHRAAAVGDLVEVERLLAAGASASVVHRRRGGLPGALTDTTTLEWAAARGHAAVVERLLDAGAPTTADGWGRGPLAMAIRHGHDAIARRLLDELAAGPLPIDLASMLVYASDDTRARALVILGDHPFVLGSAASSAMSANDPAFAQGLAERGLTEDPRWPADVLDGAVRADAAAWRWHERKDLGLTRRMLAIGPAPSVEGIVPLVESAIEEGALPALDALLASQPGLTIESLHIEGEEVARATVRGGPAMLARLLELGVDPNTPARRGFNALLPAALEADANAVALLLNAGVDPTLEEDDQTLRAWLLVRAERAAGHPNHNPHFPSQTDPDAFARIIDLLKAAEARWRAGEGGADAAGTPGGP